MCRVNGASCANHPFCAMWFCLSSPIALLAAFFHLSFLFFLGMIYLLAQGPRRGRTMLKRRSRSAVGVTMQGTTSKMSHNHTVILVVRPPWGRSYADDLPPHVKTCSYVHEIPFWGFSPFVLVSTGISFPSFFPGFGGFNILQNTNLLKLFLFSISLPLPPNLSNYIYLLRFQTVVENSFSSTFLPLLLTYFHFFHIFFTFFLPFSCSKSSILYHREQCFELQKSML